MRKKAALQKNIQLRPHQEKAINKFMASGGNQIFFHGLGSGKTISSIGAVEKAEAKSPLILTPAALQKNYTDTIKKTVTPDSQKKYNVMSFEKFRMNPEKWVNEYKPDMMVMDEYHRSKDPKSLTWRSLQKVRPRIPKFLGLTGTVVQNFPEEVFPLANIVSGGKVPVQNKKQFEQKYTENKKVYPKGIGGLIARVTGRYGEKKVLKNPDQLKKQLNPYIDKNTPNQEFLSNFPKKEFKDIQVPMSKEQQKRYDYVMKHELGPIDRWRIKHDLPPKSKDMKSFASKLTKIRQVSNSPTILSKTLKDPLEVSPKIKTQVLNLKKHLDSDPQHKAFIYSNFTRGGLDSVESGLKKYNIPYGVFSGDKKKKEKNQTIEDYNKGKLRTLLISPSGAEGLDLKGTTLEQILDPNWNPAKEQQVIGRGARFKSHIDLPLEKRKVEIERYSSTRRPNFFQKLIGKKPSTAIDQYIRHRANEKEQLTTQLNNLISSS